MPMRPVVYALIFCCITQSALALTPKEKDEADWDNGLKSQGLDKHHINEIRFFGTLIYAKEFCGEVKVPREFIENYFNRRVKDNDFGTAPETAKIQANTYSEILLKYSDPKSIDLMCDFDFRNEQP